MPCSWISGVNVVDVVVVDEVVDVGVDEEEEEQFIRNKGDNIEHKYSLRLPSTLPDFDINRTIGSQLL
jgi:hypothetical protein